LVKSKDYKDYLVFEFDTIRYDPELYEFKWNKRGNLEGYEKESGLHKFTWQPGGSQFTIIEKIPQDRLHISIKQPDQMDKSTILKAVGFDKSWYKIVSEKLPEKGQKVRQAERIEIYKEKPFYINVPAREIYKENCEENILVQGIIDLYYIDKDDNLKLLDYKTDYVEPGNEQELVKKYSKQLELYKEALEEALNKKVEKVYIYSVYLEKTIEI
jgi:hypothetical protein